METKLTYAHNDTVTVSFRMIHQAVWSFDDIPKHLYSFRLLKTEILLVTDRCSQFLLKELSRVAPLGTVIHDEQVVTATHDLLEWRRRRPTAGNGTSLIHYLTHVSAITQDNGGGGTQFQTVNAPVPFCPFCKSAKLSVTMIVCAGSFLLARTGNELPLMVSDEHFQSRAKLADLYNNSRSAP